MNLEKQNNIFITPQQAEAELATTQNPQYSDEFRAYLESLPEEKRAEEVARLEAAVSREETNEDIDMLIASGHTYQFKDPAKARSYAEYKFEQKGSLLSDIASAVGMVPKIVGDALATYKDDPADAALKTIPSAVEGFVQNARDTVGIFSQSTDPSSPFFRLKALFGSGDDEALMDQINEGILFNADSVAYSEGRKTLLVNERFVNKEQTLAFATLLEPEVAFPALDLFTLPASVARAAGYGAQMEKAAIRVQRIQSAVIGGTVKWGVGKPAQFVGNLASGAVETVASKGAAILENFTGVDMNDLERAGRTAGLATASAHVAGYSIPYAGPIAATHLGGGLLAGFGQAITETGEQILRSQGHRGNIGFARQALKDASKNGVKLTKQGEMFLKLIDTFDPALSYAYHAGSGMIQGGIAGGLISYGSQGSDAVGQGIGYGIGAGAIGGVTGRTLASGVGALRKMRSEVQAEFAIRSINEYSPQTANSLEALKNHPAANAADRQAINDFIISVSELDHNAQIRVFGGSEDAAAQFAVWRQSQDGVMEITNAQFANAEAFTVIRGRDNQLIIGVNTDVMFSPSNKYGDHTLPHELLHAVTMSSAIGPHFISVGKDLIFGVRDSEGRVRQRPLVDVSEIREFMNQYREAETGWWKNMPEGPQRDKVKAAYYKERALQESALDKLNNEPKEGESSSLSLEEEAALGKYASEFLSYYFSAMFRSGDLPSNFFLKGGKLDGLENVLQIVKDSWRDHWETRISFHEPRFDFYRNKNESIDGGFYRDGKRVRIGALDYFIRDMLKANMEFKNTGVIDFSKMSEFTKNRLLESGAGSILVRDPKTGKVRSKTRKEVRDDNKQRGASGYRVLEAISPELRRSVTGPDGVVRGEFSDTEFDVLVQNGVLTAAEAQMGKLFQRTRESNGTLPNVFEAGILAASKQIEGLGDNDRVTGDRVPLTNRKFLLADFIMEFGKDGHFTMRVKTLDMKVIDRRKAIIWQNPYARELWGDSRAAFESDFKTYLANASLPHNHIARQESARLLDKGDGRGDARRDIMHQVAGFAKGEDKPYKNTPIAQIPRGTLMSVTDFSVPTMLNLRSSGESYNYVHANAFYDIAANFKPAAFKPIAGMKNMYKNELGYRAFKKDGKFVLHAANGMHIASDSSIEKALAAAESHFENAISAERTKANDEHQKEVAKFKVRVNKREIDEVISGQRELDDIEAIRSITYGDGLKNTEFATEFFKAEWDVLFSESTEGHQLFRQSVERLLSKNNFWAEDLTPPIIKEGSNYFDQYRQKLFTQEALDNPKAYARLMRDIAKSENSGNVLLALLIQGDIIWRYANLLAESGNGLFLHTSLQDGIVNEMAFSPNARTKSGGTSLATGEGHIVSIERKANREGKSVLMQLPSGDTIGQFGLFAGRLEKPVVINHEGEKAAFLREKGVNFDEFSSSNQLDNNNFLFELDKWLMQKYSGRDIIKVSRGPNVSRNSRRKETWNYGSAVTILTNSESAYQRAFPLAFNYDVNSQGARTLDVDRRMVGLLERRKGVRASITDPRTVEFSQKVLPFITGSETRTRSVPPIELGPNAMLKPKNASEYFAQTTGKEMLEEHSHKLHGAVIENAENNTDESFINLVGTPSMERLRAFHEMVVQEAQKLKDSEQWTPMPQRVYAEQQTKIAEESLARVKDDTLDYLVNENTLKASTGIATKSFSIMKDGEGTMGGFVDDSTLAQYGTTMSIQENLDGQLTSAIWYLEEFGLERENVLTEIENNQREMEGYLKQVKDTSLSDDARKDAMVYADRAKDILTTLNISLKKTERKFAAAIENFKRVESILTTNIDGVKALVEFQSEGMFTVEMHKRPVYGVMDWYADRQGIAAADRDYVNIPDDVFSEYFDSIVSYYNLDRLPKDVKDLVEKALRKNIERATVVPAGLFKESINFIKANTTLPFNRAENLKSQNGYKVSMEPRDGVIITALQDSNSVIRKYAEWATERHKVPAGSSETYKARNLISKAKDEAILKIKNAGLILDYETYISRLEGQRDQAVNSLKLSLWDKEKQTVLADGGMSFSADYVKSVTILASVAGNTQMLKEYFDVASAVADYKNKTAAYRQQYATNPEAALSEYTKYLEAVSSPTDGVHRALFNHIQKAIRTASENFSEIGVREMFTSEMRDAITRAFADAPNGLKTKMFLTALEKINSAGLPVKAEAAQIGLLKHIQALEAARGGPQNARVTLAEVLEYYDKNSFKVEAKDKLGILDLDQGGSTKGYSLMQGKEAGGLETYGTMGAWISESPQAQRYYPTQFNSRSHMRPQANAIVHMRYSGRRLDGYGRVTVIEEIQANNSQKQVIDAVEELKTHDEYIRNLDKIVGGIYDYVQNKISQMDTVNPTKIMLAAAEFMAKKQASDYGEPYSPSNSLGNVAAEIGYYDTLNDNTAVGRLAYKHYKKALEMRMRHVRDSIDSTRALLDMNAELLVSVYSGSFKETRFPQFVREHFDGPEKAESVIRDTGMQYIESVLGDTLGKEVVNTMLGVVDLRKIVKQAWAEVMKPDVVREIHGLVQTQIIKIIGDQNKDLHHYIAFSDLAGKAMRDQTLIDKIDAIIKKSVDNSVFKNGFNFEGGRLSPDDIANVVMRSSRFIGDRGWASKGQPKHASEVISLFSDSLVMYLSQMRDLLAQAAWQKGVFDGKIDPNKDAKVKFWGKEWQIKDGSHYGRLTNGHVWDGNDPADNHSNKGSALIGLLESYTNDSPDLMNSLSRALRYLDRLTSTGSNTNVSPLDSNSIDVFSMPTDAKMHNKLSLIVQSMNKTKGMETNSQSVIANYVREMVGMPLAASTRDKIKEGARLLIQEFFGEGYRTFYALHQGIVNANATNNSSYDPKQFQAMLELIDSSGLPQVAIQQFKSHNKSVIAAAYGRIERIVKNELANKGGTTGPKISPESKSNISSIITQHVAALDEDSVNRNKRYLDLAFQPSSEHRLIAIRMAIRKAQIEGQKRVYLVNAEYSGSISGLDISKARALYGRTDPNIAKKEAKRLGFKIVEPSVIPSYLDEALGPSLTDEYKASVVERRQAALDSHKARVALVKELFPKTELKEKQVVLTGVDPELRAVVEGLGKSQDSDYTLERDFAYADTSREPLTTTYSESRGTWVYTLDGEGAFFSTDKFLQLEFLNNGNPANLASLLGQLATNSRNTPMSQGKAVKPILMLLTLFDTEKGFGDSSNKLYRQADIIRQDAMDDISKSKGFEAGERGVKYLKDMESLLVSKAEFLEAQGMKDSTHMAKIARLGAAWMKEAADYTSNYLTLLRNPRFNTKDATMFDIAATKMMAIEMPDTSNFTPLAKKEYEENKVPFYKPLVSASPNDRPFRNDFLSPLSSASKIASRVKLYAETSEDMDKYVFTVSLKRLDGKNVDEANHASEYMAVIDKKTDKATIMPVSTDYDSEYSALARAEAIERLGSFGVKRYDEPPMRMEDAEQVGEPVVVNKRPENKEAAAAMKPASKKEMAPPVATWNNRTAGYGTTLSTIDGYYIMAMNNKFRLYNAQQALVGVYSDEEEAKRRAEALRKKGKKQ